MPAFFRALLSLFKKLLFLALAVAAGATGSWLEKTRPTISFFPPAIEFAEPEEEPEPAVETPAVSITSQEEAVIAVAEKLRPSVVSIVATKELETIRQSASPFGIFEDDPFLRQFFGNPFEEQQPRQQEERKSQRQRVGAGTGFVVSGDGLLLSNRHVVEDEAADYSAVFADGKIRKTEVVAIDPLEDLAILRILPEEKEEIEPTSLGAKGSADKEFFRPVEFVESQEGVRVGQGVVAIGYALGEFDHTVTTGVVSAKGREIVAGGPRGASQLSSLLQTDAAINPGNSGGPLVSLDGKVLGVNTAIAGNAQGIGFAIPLSAGKVERLLKEIREHGKIRRPFLGVRFREITPKLNEELGLGTDHGAWISAENNLPAVVAGTPAAEAGLRAGDIILKVGGAAIDEKNSLLELIALRAPGEKISLTILRDGREEILEVELGER